MIARVLHVVAPPRYGGLVRVVSALTQGLAARRVETHVLAIVDVGELDHPMVQELRRADVPTSCVEVSSRGYRAERRHLENVVRATRAQIVHTHGSRVDVVDGPAARRLGLATVSTLHGFTGGGVKNRLYEWLQVRAVRRCDAIVAVAGPMTTRLRRAGVPTDRVHVIRNAWSPGKPPLPRADARASLGLPQEGYRIGWVGRLTDEKGPDVLLAALALLRDVPISVSFVGNGQREGALRRQALAQDLAPRITWHGPVETAGDLLGAFDLFVLSSRTEGTPIALFEAMAAGVPVVATDVGGVPDVVSNDSAWLVPADDPAALAAGIREAFGDPGGAQTRARAARARLATHFGLEQWLDAYERVYAVALDRAAARRGGGR